MGQVTTGWVIAIMLLLALRSTMHLHTQDLEAHRDIAETNQMRIDNISIACLAAML